MASETFMSMAASPNDEMLVAITKDKDIYSFPLGNIDIMDDTENHFQHGKFELYAANVM